MATKTAEPEKKSTLVRALVKPIAAGFANNTLHDEFSEPFYLVIDPTIEPAKWYEVLEEGEPVKAYPTINAARVAGEEVKPPARGIAAGQTVI